MTGRPKSSQPVPDTFTQFAGSEGDLKLRSRYRVGRSVILRWREETGIYCGKATGPKRFASRATPSRPAPYRSTPKRRYTPVTMDEISWYDGQDDIAEFAASTGLRFG